MSENNNEPTPATGTGLDELEKLLQTYDKPADISAPIEATKPAPVNGDFPWLNNGGTGATIQPEKVPSQGFSISHNPQGSEEPIRYYKTGAKAGQIKPPRKSGKPAVNVPQTPNTLQASSFLNGAILLGMLDLLLPMVLCGLNNWRSKIKINPDKLGMTPKQKEELRPAADAVLKELNINASPSLILGIAIVGIYTTNLMLLRSESEAQMKIKQNEQAKKTNNQADSVDAIRRVSNARY